VSERQQRNPEGHTPHAVDERMRHTLAGVLYIELPLGDTIYARFKDEQGNVSLIQAETSGPSGSSPMDI
jgi:hypothetical protein